MPAAEALSVLPSDQREFGRYRLLCRFATGGMANLYLARLIGSEGFEKIVAIKRIHDHLVENEEFLQMFVDEARLCARLTHPNVVQVLELGQLGGAHYIAMEYVEGETLSAVMRRTRPSMPVSARIVAAAAAGLHAAHQLRDSDGRLLNVVHRDVSPQNILISYDGAVKVVDFGVARARSNLHTTTAGQVKGKFAYMAPEQVALEPVDHRTDIFALGIVLWECTTGHRLFKASNDAATVAKVKDMDIVPPGAIVPDYPRSLEAIVMRTLQRDPDRRFATAEDLEDALEDYLIEAGVSVQPRNLAEMMRATFGDRIEAKRKMMVQAEQSRDLITSPSGLLPTSSGTGSQSGPTMTEARARILELEQRTRRRHAVAAIATVIIGLAVLVVGLVMLLADPARTTTPPPSPPVPAPRVAVTSPTPTPAPAPTPKLIKLQIKATPQAAAIVVDGKPVPNPYTLEREAGEGTLAVEISAPDFVSQELKVPLTASGSWAITLERAQKEKPAPTKRRRIHRRKLDDDLFGDPYGR